jgi:hypothetical protein
VRDLQRFEGRRVEGVKVERSSSFDAGVGSDAWGLEYTLAAGGFRAHATEIVFHHGRIVGGVSLLRADRSAVRAEALRVAGLLDGRIGGVLAGDVSGEPVSLESARPHVSEARIARMTLAKADLPAGAKLEHEKLDKSDDDHATYSRSFLARLIVLAPAGGIEPQDVRALAVQARAKLG